MSKSHENESKRRFMAHLDLLGLEIESAPDGCALLRARVRRNVWVGGVFFAVLAGCAGEVSSPDERDTNATGGAAPDGQTGGSGGRDLESSGGRAGTGGASGGEGGRASGGTGGDSLGGTGAGPSGGAFGSGGTGSVQGSEFVIKVPRSGAFGIGHPLRPTPRGTMLTSGAVAPAGWLPKGREETSFLAELSSTGEVLQIATFLDGWAPSMFAIDEEGNVFFSGMRYSNTDTPLELQAEVDDPAPYLVKLSPEFRVLDAQKISTWADSESIYAITVGPHGGVFVASTAGVAGELYTIQHPRVTKFSGATLEEEWNVLYDHLNDPQAYHRDITVLPDGSAVAGGAYHGDLVVGGFDLPRLGPPDEPGISAGFLTWLAGADGTPTRAERFGGDDSHFAHGLETTSSGGVRVLGLFGGEAHLLGQATNFASNAVAVFDVNAAGESSWLTRIDTSEEFYGHDIALGKDDQTYVVGRFGERFGEQDQLRSRVVRIEPDGSIGPHLDLFTGNSNGAVEVGVDSAGGVWFSGPWETAFEWNGKTYEPDPDGCQYIVRTEEL